MMLTLEQGEALSAITSTLLPPFSNNDSPESSILSKTEKEVWDSYCSFDISRNDEFLSALDTAIHEKLYSEETIQIKLLLSCMASAIGTSLLFGCVSTIPFSKWDDLAERTKALLSLQQSMISDKKKAFCALKRLICGTAFSYVQEDISKGKNTNPFWNAMNYPGPPDLKHNEFSISPEEEIIEKGVLRIEEDTALEYDVIIVGSGAGGSVAASVLASAGYSTIVLEKGPFIPPSKASSLEVESFDSLYEKHSLLTTQDGNIMILAGSTLGGGTHINWGCCLETPDYVREEWVEKHGLSQFKPDGDFDKSLSFILNRIGATHKDEHCKNSIEGEKILSHNKANQYLLDGCQKLGYKCVPTKTNIHNTQDETAGYTCFGDSRYYNKQGGQPTFLKDAVETGNTRIIPNCKVHEVIYENIHETKGKRKRAIGVIAHVNSNNEKETKEKFHTITIHARTVILSCGSIHTPCVLLRSGFKNKHIGEHLHLHPVSGALSFYDSPVKSYRGAPMTTVCEHFNKGPQKNGYGAKIEIPSAHTGLLGALLPWKNGKSFRETMLKVDRICATIALQRDIGEGKIKLSKDRLNPEIHYHLHGDDVESLVESICGSLRILKAAGASFVTTGHDDDNGFDISSPGNKNEDLDSEKAFEAYLEEVQCRSISKYNIPIASAHQMGSCRMGISPNNSVVDENGETWECENLYIFDASIFPTASGANPMVTTFALSKMLSQRLLAQLPHIKKYGDSQSKKKQSQEDRDNNMHMLQGSMIFDQRYAIFVVMCISYFFFTRD